MSKHIDKELADTEVCTHGHLARSCEVCSLETELAGVRAELHEARGERDEARTANAVLLDNDGIALEVVRLHALLAAATERERGLREALGEVMSWINNWGPVFTDEEEWDETAAMVTAALAAGAEGEKA